MMDYAILAVFWLICGIAGWKIWKRADVMGLRYYPNLGPFEEIWAYYYSWQGYMICCVLFAPLFLVYAIAAYFDPPEHPEVINQRNLVQWKKERGLT